MDLKLDKGKFFVPNMAFMESHGAARVQPAFRNTVLVMTPEAEEIITDRFAAATTTTVEAAAQEAGKSPAKKVEFVDKLLEVFRYDERVSRQEDVKVKVGSDENGWKEAVTSGRKAGLAHPDCCGNAWDLLSGEVDFAFLTKGGKGLSVVGSNGEYYKKNRAVVFTTLPSLEMARTQKAKGLASLATLEAEFSSLPVADFRLAQDWDQLKATWEMLMAYAKDKKVFVRACPVRPRHGFVESRIVSNIEELKAVHDETLAADPLGEWLLGEFVESSSNIVATPSSLALGNGHDGATNGSGSLTLPLASPLGLRLCDLAPTAAKLANIPDNEVPYVEMVQAKKGDKWFLTQLRAGMDMPRSADFLPYTFRVLQVIKAEGSHLKWEELMLSLADGVAKQRGIVVDHVGGGMVSHYALHAVGRGVPIVTSHHPQVGDVLERQEASAVPYDIGLLRKGILTYYADKDFELATALQTAIYAFHQGAWLRGSESYILGWAMACIHHAAVAAAAGEAGHTYDRYQCPDGSWDADVRAKVSGTESRARIVEDKLDTRNTFPYVVRVMRRTNWGNGGSYGGTLWNECVNMTLRLDDALHALFQPNADENSVGLATGVCNQVLHLAHNGGWWLNKFTSQDIMDLPYWRGDQGWLLPKLVQKVVPGLKLLLPKDLKLAKAEKMWTTPPVDAATRNLKIAWPHVVRGIRMWLPIEGKDKRVSFADLAKLPSVPLFLWVQWNFGNGLFQRFDFPPDTVKALLKGHEASSWSSNHIDMPVWLNNAGHAETSRVELPIPLDVQLLGDTKWLLRSNGLILGAPMALSGVDSELNESLLADMATVALSGLKSSTKE